MIFTLYNTAQEFSDDVLEILKRHEIQNNLLFKNISDGPNKTMASVKDSDGSVILTAIRTAPFPMVMYETDNIRNDEAVAFFARSLAEHEIDVDFIMTEKELALSFCKHSGKKYYLKESLVFYVLEKVNELPQIPGTFRKVNSGDMFYLPYWYADFAPACKIGEYNLDHGVDSATRTIERGNGYVWVDEYPVSVASISGSFSNCATIGHVYTPPPLRGKGYSTACVSHLSQKLLDDGFKYCALYADCANPYSNRVYQKVGYKETFWYDQYKLYKE